MANSTFSHRILVRLGPNPLNSIETELRAVHLRKQDKGFLEQRYQRASKDENLRRVVHVSNLNDLSYECKDSRIGNVGA